jgi:riboflavin kinase, archaea type
VWLGSWQYPSGEFAMSKSSRKHFLPKAAHIPTIIQLILQGAKDKPISLTSTELAEELGKSQQVVSKHLEELEQEGLIERTRVGRKTYVKLTEKGTDQFSSLYSTLQRAYSKSTPTIELEGTLFSGLGEAAYYVSLEGYKKQFAAKLGFEPFPGTLNLRLDRSIDRKMRNELNSKIGSEHIDGFKDGKRTFGGADFYKAKIGRLDSAVLLIERTIYDDGVLELIAPVNLRRSLNLKDGDRVRVKVLLNRPAVNS